MTGLKLRKFKSHKRYSFSRTFGSTTILTDIELDNGLSNFNQNKPNPVTGDPAYPNGCTAFARADMATNEDRIMYAPGFTYLKSCLIADVPVGSALPVETSFKSGIVYGLQAVGETTDAQALSHRRGPYFEVDQSHDDWFDSLWSALLTGKKCLSAGTVWYPEMTTASTVDTVAIRPTNDGHDWEVTGVTTQDGVPRMHVKWWGGEPKWFGRAAVNALMGAAGSDCITDIDGKATPADIQVVKLNIIEVLLSYYYELLSILKKPTGSTQPIVSVWEELEDDEQLIEKEITNLVQKPMPPESQPIEVPITPTVTVTVANNINPDAMPLFWDTPSNARHAVRVLCDLEGLSVDMKNVLTACVDQESQFNTQAKHENTDSEGRVYSTDYGICQINDFYNIGAGKPFPSVEFVLSNPEADVRWMCKQFLAGNAHLWSSYTSGAYKKWL